MGAQPSNGSTKDGCNKANSKHYPQVTRSIYSSPLCNPTRPFTARDSSTRPTPANHSKFLRCHGKKLRYPGPKLYPQKSYITCTHVTLTLPAQKRQAIARPAAQKDKNTPQPGGHYPKQKGYLSKLSWVPYSDIRRTRGVSIRHVRVAESLTLTVDGGGGIHQIRSEQPKSSVARIWLREKRKFGSKSAINWNWRKKKE